ncbi:serine/threonine-protein kinase DCLK3 [Apodemus sylvaticus]|uniref:serine/threonine-protein kinase DCLK3 n=1 Tax=Apodemus sylvaticus TaxID=10129 RepID=UPI0022436F7A|nr:serine/threonine-protein kinase DCLK3 [Apodemus sylvaticus]
MGFVADVSSAKIVGPGPRTSIMRNANPGAQPPEDCLDTRVCLTNLRWNLGEDKSCRAHFLSDCGKPSIAEEPIQAEQGHRGPCDHSLKCLSSKISERKLPGSWLPAGRGPLEKPVLGSRGAVMPLFSPQSSLHTVRAEHSPLKPRVVTVVKLGGQPLRKATLLLNRRSVQTFEQLLSDISEALGFPRWKNDRVRKLFTLKGREVKSVSDFFREGDAFIAMGKEPLTLKNIQLAMEELYPKNRALALAPHSRAPSPRLRSRLPSKLLKGSHRCGEAGGYSEVMGSKAVSRHQGKTSTELSPEDKARAQKWVRGKQESEPGGLPPPREAAQEETQASGEKHLGVEIEKSSGEIVRCEKCKRERELQLGLQREQGSLGTSELDLGRGQKRDSEKMVRTKSCRRASEAKSADEEDGWKGDSHRGSPRDPPQELRRPNSNSDKKEIRGSEGQESHPQGSAKAQKDLVEGPPAAEEGPADMRRGARHPCRNKHPSWLLREQQAEPPQLPRSRREGKEAEHEKKPGGLGGRKALEKESKTKLEEKRPERGSGRKLRPTGIISADVEKHYDIGRVIGDGNFATVKECRHRETKQAYAMKIIDKSQLKGREDIVDSEILIIQSLFHPNIVKLHEVYEAEAEIYLIMEYVQGGDLFDAIIENVKFPEPDAAVMITDLCKALVHMHDKKIVHRDVKPENLLAAPRERLFSCSGY